jgi:3-oxoacyl-[acyl-carrier-protein] synthase II
MVHRVLGSSAASAVMHQHQVHDRSPARAAGALESIATVLALHHRVVPPTINLDDVDDAVELDIATKPRDLPPATSRR